MKKLFSLFLILALCLSVCCAGIAEEAAAADEAAGMEAFFELVKMIPGMEEIDFETFYKDLKEKMDSGAEITLEECLPAEAWQLFLGNMASEDDPYTIETIVKGNEIASIYTYKEQISEEDAKKVADSVAASFETPETMANMKSSMEQMASGGIDVNKVVMELKFLNADGSVIYDKVYTYADLAAAEEPAA